MLFVDSEKLLVDWFQPAICVVCPKVVWLLVQRFGGDRLDLFQVGHVLVEDSLGWCFGHLVTLGLSHL